MGNSCCKGDSYSLIDDAVRQGEVNRAAQKEADRRAQHEREKSALEEAAYNKRMNQSVAPAAFATYIVSCIRDGQVACNEPFAPPCFCYQYELFDSIQSNKFVRVDNKQHCFDDFWDKAEQELEARIAQKSGKRGRSVYTLRILRNFGDFNIAFVLLKNKESTLINSSTVEESQLRRLKTASAVVLQDD